MVHSCLLGSSFVRSQRNLLPKTFYRYKSLTQAIERGKQSYDSPQRTRSRFDGGPDRRQTSESTFRREPRGDWKERGTDQPRAWNRDGQNYGDRNDRRNDRGGGFRERRDNGERFGERGARDGAFAERSERPTTFQRGNDCGTSFGNRNGEESGFREKRPFQERRDGRPPFNRDGDRPFNRDGGRPFDRDGGRPSNRDGGRPFDRDAGRSFNRDAGRPFDRDAGRSFNRDAGRSFNRDGDRSFNRDGGRPFNRDGGRPSPEPREAREPGMMIPESLPFTTAASDFMYGYSSVFAALKANRRQFYKLYIHTRGQNRLGNDELVAKAKQLRIDIQEVGDEYLRVFDKTSSGRPHNGFILEASPLPVPPITELRTSSKTASTFEVTLGKQTKEDMAVNGTKENYTYKSGGWRHPLVLYVDGVLDEGNLGAIARSAYLLGVDAIVTPSRQVAPWSHIAIKASAGAAEAIPIFSVQEPGDFLGNSSRQGWRLYASDAIREQAVKLDTVSDMASEDAASEDAASEDAASEDAVSEDAAPESISRGIVYSEARSSKLLPVDHCPVDEHPTILMMGAESTGLRAGLLKVAHYKVGIRHGREVDEVGVDSLNVSVAASLLCYEMLQKPKHPGRKSENLLF